MNHRPVNTLLAVGMALIAWEALVRPVVFSSSALHAVSPVYSDGKDNEELARLYKEDQDDRKPGEPIDWELVSERDRKREARVKELYKSDQLVTGADYYHTAMILQHASRPEDFLLAHEFCVVAIGKGEKKALWLAAATEDRFLMNLKRPQRFGTQYRSEKVNEPAKLYEVDVDVTDKLRREFNTPSLKDAKAREAMIDSLFKNKGEKKP